MPQRLSAPVRRRKPCFAPTYLEPGPAAGQLVRLSGPSGPGDPLEVIGLVSDAVYQSPQQGMVPTLFVPAGLNPATSLIIRVDSNHDARLDAVLPELLRQIDARDLPTMAGAAVILALTGFASAWLPARRAARFNPSELLRDS